jgi:hypothetical protein
MERWVNAAVRIALRALLWLGVGIDHYGRLLRATRPTPPPICGAQAAVRAGVAAMSDARCAHPELANARKRKQQHGRHTAQ